MVAIWGKRSIYILVSKNGLAGRDEFKYCIMHY